MAPTRKTRADADLYRRIGFDPRVEAEALRALSRLDLPACRAGFLRLVDPLRLESLSLTTSRQTVHLLLDILQRVNRRIHPASFEDDAGHEQRRRLIARFAAIEQAATAREAFLASLNRLLTPLERAPRNAHPLVERAQIYIEENYHDRVSLSTVASHLHVSPNYLSRTFKKETGLTLTRYVHHVRLEHAMLLLSAGERSISEIAYLVGYQNYRDFYRNFVKYHSASPRQVQRRLGLSESGVAAPGGAS